MEKQMKADDLAICEGDDFTTAEELEELKKEGFTDINELKEVVVYYRKVTTNKSGE